MIERPSLVLPAPRTRAEALADALEAEITTAGAEPGAWFGTLEEIRERTGVARATVSEAVRLLRERGILDIRPGRGGGLFVAAPSPIVRLRHHLLTVRDAPSDVREAIALREALEELIAVEAARHCSEADAARLAGQLERLERAVRDPERFMRENWALHERIADIGTNTMAAAVYRGTLGYMARASAVSSDDPGEEHRRRRHRVHAELVHAIVTGDEPAIREAVRRHNADY